MDDLYNDFLKYSIALVTPVSRDKTEETILLGQLLLCMVEMRFFILLAFLARSMNTMSFNIPLRAVQEAPSISRRRGRTAAEHLTWQSEARWGEWMEPQTAVGKMGGGKRSEDGKETCLLLGSTLQKYELAVLERKDYVGCQKTYD